MERQLSSRKICVAKSKQKSPVSSRSNKKWYTTLLIETGRFRGTKLEQRICKLCDDDQIESEIHFILLCKRYSKSRERFFKSIGVNLINYVSDNLMKDMFEKFPRAFAKYCNEIYELRKSALFSITTDI